MITAASRLPCGPTVAPHLPGSAGRASATASVAMIPIRSSKSSHR